MIPLAGKEHYSDMTSTASKFAKANAARRFAEMIVDEFLSKDLKSKVGNQVYDKMEFYKKLEAIKNSITREMFNALISVKSIGDRGSHHGDGKNLNEQEVNKAIDIASNDLIPLIFHNYFSKVGFFSIDYGPKIFSTLNPSLREQVLFMLIDFRSKKQIAVNNIEKNLLHKYVIACHKNGNREKIRKKLRDLYSKSRIDKTLFDAFSKTIENFDLAKDTLPIPTLMEDSKRNFLSVLDSMDEDDCKKNKELIEIISSLLDGIHASEMKAGLEPNKTLHNPLLQFEKI